MTTVLSLPKLAKCDNRTQLPKTNSKIGGPEEWLTQNLLFSLGYYALSFDFIINWNKRQCANEIWLKRISSILVAKLVHEDYIKLEVENLGDNLPIISEFAEKCDFQPHYQIFRDAVNWGGGDEKILKAQIISGSISNSKIQ